MKMRHRRRHVCYLMVWWDKDKSRVYRNDVGRKGFGDRHDGRMAWWRD